VERRAYLRRRRRAIVRPGNRKRILTCELLSYFNPVRGRRGGVRATHRGEPDGA
jgi:hypothetical protein